MPRALPLALLALTLGAFAIGTTEFVIVGLVPTIANDLHVSLPSAGLLVSLYALGVAVGAPVLTALTGRVPRKALLVALMLVFTLGNLLAWMAPGYAALVVARVLTGLTHGVFFSIGSIIATSVVPKEKAASAIAIMFSGLTVALVTGVPLGTFIGQHLGWRATFLVVSAFGALALLGSLLCVPRNLPRSAAVGFAQQLAVLTQPRLLLVYAMTTLGYGGLFLFFTFLAPILQQVTGFSANAVSVMLLGYGVSVAIGNIWGGRLADRLGPVPALKRIFALLALALLALTFTAHSAWLVVPSLLVVGALAFGNVPGLQVYVVKQAQRFVPQAIDVASGLNIAAFNIGIAMGASLGGLVLQHVGLMHTPWMGALMVSGGLLLTILSGRLDRRDGMADGVHGIAARSH